MRTIDPSRIKRILLIRPDAIGDMVLATPAIAALRNKFPQAQIAVLARGYNQTIIKNNPAIDEIILDDLYPHIINRKMISPIKYWQWVQLLKQKKFDLMINFYGEFPYALTAFLAGIPYRIGDKARILFSWLYNFPVWQKFSNSTIHEVKHHFELLKPLNIDLPKDAKLNVYPSQNAIREAKQILEKHNMREKKLIAVTIGTGRTDKPWDIKKVKQLIKILAHKYNTKIIFLGGPKEKALADQILPEIDGKIINLVGISLELLIGIISQMRLYIGNNTGPSHIAAALNIPSIVLFCSKAHKPGRWAPWGNQHKIFEKADKTTPEEVAAAAEELKHEN